MKFIERVYLLPLVVFIAVMRGVMTFIVAVGDFIADGEKPW